MRFSRTIAASDRRGFTMVELAVVLVIGGILIGFAAPRLQAAFHQRDVNGARDGVILLAAQARARAMERAAVTELHLDVDRGIASVIEAGDTVEVFAFAANLGVASEAELSAIRLCYTARGFATRPCSTALGGVTEVEFSRANYTAVLEIWQLGQVRKL